MVSCSACGCSKTPKNIQLGITFHRLPKNIEQRKVWLAFVNRDESTLSRTSFVCSQHFIEEDFDRTSQCKVALKPNAVPSKVILRAKYDRATTKPGVYISMKAEKKTLGCLEENHLNTNEINNETHFAQQNSQEEKHLPDIPDIKTEILSWEENLDWSQELQLPNTIDVKKEPFFSEQTGSEEKHLSDTIDVKHETLFIEQTPSCSQENHLPDTKEGEIETLYIQTPGSEERIPFIESVLETPREKRMKYELNQLSIKYLHKVKQARTLQKSNWAQKKRISNLKKVIKELKLKKNSVLPTEVIKIVF